MSTESSGIPPAPPSAAPTAHLTPPDTGSTWISDAIVAKIAGIAACEVDGVEGLRSESGGRGWGRGAKETDEAGVTVEDGVAAIDLRLVVRDGINIPTAVEAVRTRVISRVQEATGMRVSKVDIGVVDVVVPTPAADESAQDDA